jgi:uncharacterized membrane protein
MAASRVIVRVLGLLPVFYLAGIFEPGPLVPGLGPFFDQLVIFAVLALLALIVKPQWLLLFWKKEPSDRNESKTSAAEQILRERYARGELDRNQFIVMLEDHRMPIPRKT